MTLVQLINQPSAQEEKTSVSSQMTTQDQFFCALVNAIPKQVYFPTDAEENWLKSGGKASKKYQKNTKANAPKQTIKETSKKGKRARFNPENEKSNTELQQEAVRAEEAAAQEQQSKSKGSMSDLRDRLQARIENLRQKRKGSEKPEGARAQKRRKSAKSPVAKTEKKQDSEQVKPTATEKPARSNISYGNLLLDQEKLGAEAPKPKGKAGIKNLLKKAEENQKKMEELKESEEGKALVQAKGWEKAIKQAAGEKVLDDPKLLRKAIKRKEKAKQKSSKEWKQRISMQEKQSKERQQKKRANIRGKRVKGGDKQRAGFEGKKGSDKFLNGKSKAKKSK